MPRTPLILLLVSVSLTGCFRGNNVKGDFACKAPGGTCAPMSVIDGVALAGMGTSSGSVGAIRSPGSLPPPTSAVRTVSTASLDDSVPARTSERVLRVVFPAHIDRDGIYREESAAHAVVEPTSWAQALGGFAPEQPRRVPALRPSGATPASTPTGQQASMPATSLLASMDEVIAAQAARRAANGATAPAASSPAAPGPVAPAGQSAVLSQFAGPSRAPVPMSLAEAAAGLAALPVRQLDPVGPGNYDSPDVTAAVAAAVEPNAKADPARVAGALDGPPMRTVRWKGKLYRIPVKNAATASAPLPPQPETLTADLNRRALASMRPVPAAPRAEREAEQGSTEPDSATSSVPIAAGPVSALATDGRQLVGSRVRTMASPHIELLNTKNGALELVPAATAEPSALVQQGPRQ